MRVLVVEDDRTLREGLVGALRDEGWVAEGAAHGGEAIARLVHGPVEALIVDLVMPVMDGHALRRWVRASDRHGRTPIVMLSGHDAMPWSPGPCEAVLRKPFDLDELLGTIVRLTGEEAR
jgi:DNA-binding response OmpR family regulator